MSSGSSGRSATGSRTEEVQAQIDSIQRDFNRLEGKADLADVHEAIGRIEERLARGEEWTRVIADYNRRSVHLDLVTEWFKQHIEYKRKLHKAGRRGAAKRFSSRRAAQYEQEKIESGLRMLGLCH